MKIHLVEAIGSGATFVAPILVERLDAFAHDESRALTAFGASMNVRIGVGATIGDPPDGAAVGLQAQSGRAPFFPVFIGTLRVVSHDVFSSRLVLAGDYRVPLGVLGEVADRTLLAGAAKRSLQSFLARIRDEIATAVLQAAGR